jgi:maltooligosyltrehalose trehalohydrolase
MQVDYDEEQRWIALHRGAFTIVCNLGDETVTVPVAGEVVLASADPTVGDATELPGQSFTILRTATQ